MKILNVRKISRVILIITFLTLMSLAIAKPVSATNRWAFLDGADCNNIWGWAGDWDSRSTIIWIELAYEGSSTSFAGMNADQYRADLCTGFGSCNHAFSYPTPAWLKNGVPHTITLRSPGSSIAGSPKTINCGGASYTCPAAALNTINTGCRTAAPVYGTPNYGYTCAPGNTCYQCYGGRTWTGTKCCDGGSSAGTSGKICDTYCTCNAGLSCVGGRCRASSPTCPGPTTNTIDVGCRTSAAVYSTLRTGYSCTTGQCYYCYSGTWTGTKCCDGGSSAGTAGKACDIYCTCNSGLSCIGGRCQDACTGVTCSGATPKCLNGNCVACLQNSDCTTPPASACPDTYTLRTYNSPGTCTVSHTCSYSSSTQTCPNGCVLVPPDYHGECNTQVCGNGIKEGSEQCDNGGNNGACPKTCSASCTTNNCDPCAGVTCSPDGNYCNGAVSESRNYGCSGGTCSYTVTSSTTCIGSTPYCSSGSCVACTQNSECTSPPAPTCANSNTKRTYNSPGTCAGGICGYALYTDSQCSFGCLNGQCNSDPCGGVTCNPDGNYCNGAVSENRNYGCSAGTCSYSIVSSSNCQYGCNSATGQCNSDPCGGVTCNPDGNYCNGAVSENRNYGCSAGTCSYSIVSSSNCQYGCNSATGQCNGCSPNWQCTAWSACSAGGTQTRTCTDANSCGTTSGKPAESQPCSPTCPGALGACDSSKSNCVQQCSGITYYCLAVGSSWSWRLGSEVAAACDDSSERCLSFQYPSGCSAVQAGNPLSYSGKCYAISGGASKTSPAWRYSPEEVCNNGEVRQQGAGGCTASGLIKVPCDTMLICNNECTQGATRCSASNTKQFCNTNYDSDVCSEWGGDTNCPNGCSSATNDCIVQSCGNGIREGSEQCDNGGNNGACPKTCSASCTTQNCDCSATSTCNSGTTCETKCATETVDNYCRSINDGAYQWYDNGAAATICDSSKYCQTAKCGSGRTFYCTRNNWQEASSGQTCSDGYLGTNECTSGSRRCDPNSNGYQTCQLVNGFYKWSTTTACTGSTPYCSSGSCVACTSNSQCTNVPATTCSNYIKTAYSASCSGGTCSYPSSQVPCGFGCNSAGTDCAGSAPTPSLSVNPTLLPWSSTYTLSVSNALRNSPANLNCQTPSGGNCGGFPICTTGPDNGNPTGACTAQGTINSGTATGIYTESVTVGGTQSQSVQLTVVQCTGNAQCSGSTPNCDLTSKTCVQCTSSTQCTTPPSQPYCENGNRKYYSAGTCSGGSCSYLPLNTETCLYGCSGTTCLGGEPENTIITCEDGVDNDRDGLTDCADDECVDTRPCLLEQCQRENPDTFGELGDTPREDCTARIPTGGTNQNNVNDRIFTISLYTGYAGNDDIWHPNGEDPPTLYTLGTKQIPNTLPTDYINPCAYKAVMRKAGIDDEGQISIFRSGDDGGTITASNFRCGCNLEKYSAESCAGIYYPYIYVYNEETGNNDPVLATDAEFDPRIYSTIKYVVHNTCRYDGSSNNEDLWVEFQVWYGDQPGYHWNGQTLTCELASVCPGPTANTQDAGCQQSQPTNSADLSSTYYCSSGKCYQCNSGFSWDTSTSSCKIILPACPSATANTQNAGCQQSQPTNSADASSSYSCSSGKCYQCSSGYVWDGTKCTSCDSYCRSTSLGACTSSTQCEPKRCSCNNLDYYCRVSPSGTPNGWVLPGDPGTSCGSSNYCVKVQCGGKTFTCKSPDNQFVEEVCSVTCQNGVCCGDENEPCCAGTCGSGRYCTGANRCCYEGNVWDNILGKCFEPTICLPNYPLGNLGPNVYCIASEVCCPNLLQTGPTTYQSDCGLKSTYIATY